MHPIDPTEITLTDWMDDWFRVYKLPAVKEKTSEIYRLILDIIGRGECSQHRLTEITEWDLQELLNATAAAGYSRSVIDKTRYTLRQIFKPLLRQKLIDVDPTLELVLPLAPTKEVLPLTHEQQNAVERAAAEDPLGHLIVFLLQTGLRRNEMRELLWSDYNPVDHSIFVSRSKTTAGVRKVYLTRRAEAIVLTMPRINKYIFNHTRGGQVTEIVMRRLIDRLRRNAGVPALACHVCRHTFVTRLCEEGVPAKAIAQIIGHAKTDYVLDIYAKLESDELRKAIYALEPDAAVDSDVMGAIIRLPVQLFQKLQETAEAQHIDIDVYVTHLLTLDMYARE